MFTGFFYLLRAHGFRVSLNEWMTLIEGLMLDLQHDSLTGFYELCRAVLVKSEADYDKFDQIFLEYFDGVPYQDELPKELMDWLNNPAAAMEEFRKFLRTQGYEEKSIEEILKMFEERLKEQTEEHNGGSYWIGTNGYSNFGNSGPSQQTRQEQPFHGPALLGQPLLDEHRGQVGRQRDDRVGHDNAPRRCAAAQAVETVQNVHTQPGGQFLQDVFLAGGLFVGDDRFGQVGRGQGGDGADRGVRKVVARRGQHPGQQAG